MGFREAVERRIRERRKGRSSYTPSPEFEEAVERRVRPLTEVEKAIIARDILAEGSIYHRALFPRRRGRVRCQYGLRIEFTSGEKEYAEDFQRRAGGGLKWSEPARAWKVIIDGRPAMRRLEESLPYLVGVKREAAEMAVGVKLAWFSCEKGRPPLPRFKLPPQAPHTPKGKAWLEEARLL